MPDICIFYDWIHVSLKCLDTRLYVCVYLDSMCIIIYSATGAASSATCSDCVAGKYSRYVSSTSTCALAITATPILILYMLLILLILAFSSVCAFCCWIHWCASRYFVLLSSKLLTHLCYAWYMYTIWLNPSLSEMPRLDTRLYVCVYLDSVYIIIYIISSGAGTCSDCVAGKYSRYVSSTSTCAPTITTTLMLILYMLLILLIDVF